MPCNESGFTNPDSTIGWGIVDFDCEISLEDTNSQYSPRLDTHSPWNPSLCRVKREGDLGQK